VGWGATVDGPGGIVVTGGVGGVSVALEDLARAAVVLHECGDALGRAAFGVHRLDLWSAAALLAGPDVAGALAAAQWRSSAAVGLLRDLGQDLDGLAWRTRRAVTGYRLGEQEAELALRVTRRVTVAGARGLQAGGQPVGLLLDGSAAPARPVPVDADSLVRIRDLASVMTSQSLVSDRSVVRVVEVSRGECGSAWLLQIPGTQVWDPRAGPVVFDLTSDVRLMGDATAALTAGALDALRRAQAESGRLGMGDPVMVSGHSLGGLAAMAIASDGAVRRELAITHVLTAGSPVGHIDVPAEVSVLSLEHVGDVVPRLDLVANPDRPHWTTVRRDVPGARVVPLGGGASEHAALTYRETARLADVATEDGSEPSLVAWSASAAPFLGRAAPLPTAAGDRCRVQGGAGEGDEQRVRDYRVSRVAQSPP
jgi:hypothetical protein